MKISKKMLAIPVVLSCLYFQQNKTIKRSNYIISSNKIPKSFNNFKIVHLSDIHANKIGYSDQIFLNDLKQEMPDIIVITGDIFDSYNNEKELVYNLLAQFVSIAPCYFVSGNHELRLKKEYEELQVMLKKLNIVHLKNDSTVITREKEHIKLVGIEDFNYFRYTNIDTCHYDHRKILKELYAEDLFNILLAHRPEKLSVYSGVGYDLVFSGHAHGGQWNIPFLGRIFSPSQGFFPKYTNGIYIEDSTTMLVSQGLGNSSFPTRINNRLEMIIVKLSSNN